MSISFVILMTLLALLALGAAIMVAVLGMALWAIIDNRKATHGARGRWKIRSVRQR